MIFFLIVSKQWERGGLYFVQILPFFFLCNNFSPGTLLEAKIQNFQCVTDLIFLLINHYCIFSPLQELVPLYLIRKFHVNKASKSFQSSFHRWICQYLTNLSVNRCLWIWLTKKGMESMNSHTTASLFQVKERLIITTHVVQWKLHTFVHQSPFHWSPVINKLSFMQNKQNNRVEKMLFVIEGFVFFHLW